MGFLAFFCGGFDVCGEICVYVVCIVSKWRVLLSVLHFVYVMLVHLQLLTIDTESQIVQVLCGKSVVCIVCTIYLYYVCIVGMCC